nr:PQ-loop domain-containing transporter [Hydrocoleum sp. CS-953]
MLGLLAGSLTTISFLPQVIKTWRTRSTKDIS